MECAPGSPLNHDVENADPLLPTPDFLRSPSITPSLDTSCPNPASMTTIVCALWKNKLYPWDGINTGEIRGKNFTVIIAGMSLTPTPSTCPSPWPRVALIDAHG